MKHTPFLCFDGVNPLYEALNISERDVDHVVNTPVEESSKF